MFEIDIKDGRLLVRPVVPGDKRHLLAGFEHLSQRSRFFRFLSMMSRLSDEDLKRFTSEGNDEHRAFGALDIGETPPVPVAIARYERFDDLPDAAEMAITVVDAYQGRGIGTLMIGAIAYCATGVGITRFIAYVHRENHGMIALLRAAGGTVQHSAETELTFVLPLSSDPALYPMGRSGDRLRQAYALMADPTSATVGAPPRWPDSV
ncbi:GNAT family N-acetyltransferase [Pararhizobium haloflavum]|uniref:GNAT family N-acetyltransferase n=1 Tax=Pararhizobium haloflavum TaxID=2037914 RepID=UPI000C187B51|nr:GNAT family N-acetyltransferase [Pararhizobium haloflavum]